MSRLFQLMWDDPWKGVNVPSFLQDQHFGTVIPDDSCLAYGRLDPFVCPPGGRAVPRWDLQGTGRTEVVNTDNEFRVNMDVRHFKPGEIKITTKDNRVVINARHEEQPDEHGFIMRGFTRTYVLPKDVDPNTVTSSLNQNGILTLKAPKMALELTQEQVIPITFE